MNITDYEAFQWKAEKAKSYKIPNSSEYLTIKKQTENISEHKEIAWDLNFPILNTKVKDLCMMASSMIRKNSFCSENFSNSII